MSQMRIEIDGAPASVEALGNRALANYGHYTSMQARDGSVRGFNLHLRRLKSATLELFDADLDTDRVRYLVRHALGQETSASIRVDVFQSLTAEDVSVMVTVRPPAEMPAGSQRLQTVIYERPLAHIKHVGTFAQIYHHQQAERNGFDDALLTGRDGALYEGTSVNVGFVGAASVVWPQGPALHGITWQLLDEALPKFGFSTVRRIVRVADLRSFRAVFVTNSLGSAAVNRIDDIHLPSDNEAIDLMGRAYKAIPWQHI